MKNRLTLILALLAGSAFGSTSIQLHNVATTPLFAAVFYQQIVGGSVFNEGWNGGAVIPARSIGAWQGTFYHSENTNQVYRYTVYWGIDSGTATNIFVLQVPSTFPDAYTLHGYVGGPAPGPYDDKPKFAPVYGWVKQPDGSKVRKIVLLKPIK